MQKITKKFVKKSFKKAAENYTNAIVNIGLWESEKYVINKYFDKDKSILDIGCGAGKTIFNLYEMGYRNIIGLDLTSEMLENAGHFPIESPGLKKLEIELISFIENGI
jgi:ubiquinone/menaquinone biosynthesis C-methylase UbiE